MKNHILNGMKSLPKAHAPGLKRCAFGLMFAAVALCKPASAQQLQVTYGAKGVQTLSFGGTTMMDVNASSGDAFHIYHMKCEDMAGNALSAGQYGWGENNNSTTWNASTHTETYTFSWGTIAVQFLQNGNVLDLVVTETNFANSGVKFDGAEIYPFLLHFPRDPAGFHGYSQFLNTTTGPGVSAADFSSGIVTAVVPDESVPMHNGWKNVGPNTYSPLMSTTSPDGLAAFLPHTERPVAPGSSFRYTVSLRFTAQGVAADASDAYRSFASTYPSQMTWSDRRILGTAYLASSPPNLGDKTKSGGFATNPRRYFNDPSVDITTASGLQLFQNRMLAQAAGNVTNTRSMNGQGVVTWDLEGEQYPQDTSYVCSPEQVAAVAPEMESIVLDKQSAYAGMKLDDAYFKTMTDAGLRVGVCVRPQVFALTANGSASQSFLGTPDAIVANLEKKIAYAHTRWGVTVFYVDSTVDSNGGTLDPAIFQRLITDYPGFLLIPEETTPRYYAYSAPFYSFLFHGDTGTDASVYRYYPKAFGVNLVNDVAASTLQSALPALIQAVSKGDVLMGHADYWQANDPTLVSIYQAAGVGMPSIQVTPSITWPQPAPITYGTPLTSAQLNASTTTAGVFTYTPAPGSVLQGGTSTLVTTFTPADGRDYTTATASTSLQVVPDASPIIWPAPAAIIYGTPLSSLQLNPTSAVQGSFQFISPEGTVLPAGTATLRTNFTPDNTSNFQAAQASTTILVSRATPKITWNTPGAITAGTALGQAQLNASANVPGTFTYLPPYGGVPAAGTTLLSAVFTPQESSNYSPASATVTLLVNAAGPVAPQAVWPTPDPIVYGTPLSGRQLNASFSAPGTITYTPGANTMLVSGTNTLQARFTPSDPKAFQPATATVQIAVTKAQPVITWANAAAINSGTPLNGTQLNATASVPGNFQYSPSAGTLFAPSVQTLSTQFMPVDTLNYTPVSASVTIQVNAPAPAPIGNLYITYPSAGDVLSGPVTVSGICRLALDPAGTYLMVDGNPIGTRRVVDGPYVYPLDTRSLSNGAHTLQIWGHDIGNNVTISPAVTVTIAN